MQNEIIIGSIVSLKRQNYNIFFKVTDIEQTNSNEKKIILSGIDYRIKFEEEEKNLELVKREKFLVFKEEFFNDINKRVNKILKKRKIDNNARPGKVLHIDSDKQYLNLCLNYYEKLLIPAKGEHISVNDQPEKILDMLKKHMPDIVIITGHDYFNKDKPKDELKSYRNSKYFVEAVKEARIFQPFKDSLIIFAGACQSHYEELIEAGANIASSPNRILIHALDPVFAAEKIAYTSIDTILTGAEILENTITGAKGLGCFQTRGTLRYGNLISEV